MTEKPPYAKSADLSSLTVVLVVLSTTFIIVFGYIVALKKFTSKPLTLKLNCPSSENSYSDIGIGISSPLSEVMYTVSFGVSFIITSVKTKVSVLTTISVSVVCFSITTGSPPFVQSDHTSNTTNTPTTIQGMQPLLFIFLLYLIVFEAKLLYKEAKKNCHFMYLPYFSSIQSLILFVL